MTSMSAVAPHRTRRTIRTLTGALVASTLLGTVACAGGDSSTGPRTTSKNIAGLYALYTVNKKQIPIQIYRGRYYYPDLELVAARAAHSLWSESPANRPRR